MVEGDSREAELLDDVVVVDLADDAGEAAGKVLADLGATVVKVEPPDGCAGRHRGPFAPDGSSLYWAAWGRGKRSVVLDLEAAADRAAFEELLAGADVLIETFTATERMAAGLDPGDVGAAHPSLIHVSVTPFGATGPLADAPATDMTLSAAGGLLNHQGDKDRPPLPIGFPETCHHGGVQAAADAVAALVARDRTGAGQHLDVSTQAAVVGTLLWTASYAAIDRNPRHNGDDRGEASTDRGGEVVPGIRNPVVEPCADGHVVLTYVLGAQGLAAFDATMRWLEEEDVLDNDLCGRNWHNWIDEMKAGALAVNDGARAMTQALEFLKTKTKAEIHARSVSHKMLVAPCNNAADLLADPQLLARDFWIDVDGLPLPGPFARLSRTPLRVDRPAPALGADQALLDAPRQDRPVVQMRTDSPGGIYAGLKVADFTWMAAGPLITRDLANHGATVVHAESMARIDTMRWLPPYFGETFTPDSGLPAANANQSKLGLACNLGASESRELVDRLIDWADVVVENFRPGMAAKNGFGWEQVRARSPGAVMLSTSMRGQTGPEAEMIGFGLQGAAMAGFVDITGWPDRTPIAPWGAYTDFVSPRYALAALHAALRERSRSGVGQYIDLSQNEAGVHFLAPLVLDHAVNGTILARPGSSGEAGAPSGVFAGAGSERYLVVSALSEAHWNAVRSVVPGLGEETFDELDDAADRLAQRGDIERAFADWAMAQDVFDAADRLRNAGCPASASMRARDLIRDPQLAHREFFTPLPHAAIDARYDGPVTIFSETPWQPTAAGPTIGQHNEHVLKNLLGYTDDEITELAIAGVLS